jgi:hypothetical protein
MEFGKNGCISEVFYLSKKYAQFIWKSKPIGSDSKKNLDVYLLNLLFEWDESTHDHAPKICWKIRIVKSRYFTRESNDVL